MSLVYVRFYDWHDTLFQSENFASDVFQFFTVTIFKHF